MGIGFTYKGCKVPYSDRPHWSYGGFSSFRERLAAGIGIDLVRMRGYGAADALSWDKIADPIAPLLNHSDCEGDLSAEQCRIVSPRLRELVQDWPDDYDKQNALLLADMMDACVLAGAKLKFC